MKVLSTAIALLLFSSLLSAQNGKWGWDAHRYINEQAVDFLPAEMIEFKQQRTFLREHSVDPDTDTLPGYYHYIDIDVYPEFFNGTLPHGWDAFVSHYGENTAISNGIVPWIVEQWSDSLTVLLANHQWNDAWQVAAELGHYIADSHQPLHLTENYNGQLTGNYGIHSRYESQLVSPYLSGLPPATGQVSYWTSPIDSVFDYIDFCYPIVDDIIAADDAATSADPSRGSVYYSTMWQYLETPTTKVIHRAIRDLASAWYTAWVRAGNATGISDEQALVPDDLSIKAYPNPFNPQTTIHFELAQSAAVTLTIYSLNAEKIITLVDENMTAGSHSVQWNAAPLSSGMYIAELVSGKTRSTRRLMLLK